MRSAYVDCSNTKAIDYYRASLFNLVVKASKGSNNPKSFCPVIPFYRTMRFAHLFLPFVALMIVLSGMSCMSGNNLGLFENATNVGDSPLGGSAQFDAKSATYTVTGSGSDIYGTYDEFYYVWRQVSGDVTLAADVEFADTTGHMYRKAGWMLRADLEADAPYVDVLVHADGLIALQYRSERGGETSEVLAAVRSPATIRLERTADLFTAYVDRPGEHTRVIASVTVELPESAYAGLVVCAHDASVQETAYFTNVRLDELGTFEERIVESTLEIIDRKTGDRQIVRQAREHFEAPNWSPDSLQLVYNSSGLLYWIPVEGGEPQQIDTDFATRCNNDHGFSPDGTELVISHSPEGGSSTIYILPAEGGTPRQITEHSPSYWHGWSPDGETLVYCARRDGEYDVYAISVNGGEETRLTTAPGLDDGPEYSPDGRTIFFNSVRTGQMKIWRMDPDGTSQAQVTPDDEYGDWFPHPSPDGRWIVFLSYDKSVEGHPPNRNVVLRIMPIDGTAPPQVLATLFGGQGTINVPSWSPDSRHFAFVSYRLVGGS